MRRKIIVLVMVGFLLLLSISAGSSIGAGDQNQNLHEGDPNNEDTNGEPVTTGLNNEIPEQDRTGM